MTVVHEAKEQIRVDAPSEAADRRSRGQPLVAVGLEPVRASFEIHEAYDGEWVRLRLTGELRLGSAPVLRHRLVQLRAEKRPVRLDLSGLEFMDSSGIHLLTGAFNDAREDGWQLGMDSALSPQVDRLFKLAGLNRIVPGLRPERPVARVERPAATGNHAARTAFDRALELLELRRAADAYASRHGEPGSATYRAAWLRFRQRIQSIEDLQRRRASFARPKSIRPKAPTAPTNRGIRLPDRTETGPGQMAAGRVAASRRSTRLGAQLGTASDAIHQSL